jgi:hypothetical protein
MSGLYNEVESIVLAFWDEDPEEIVAEVSSRLNISEDYAFDLVQEVFVKEAQQYNEMIDDYAEPDEFQEWYDFDPDC